MAHSDKAVHFAFLVHPLVAWHRRILGVRRWHLPLMLGKDDVGIDGVGVVGQVRIPTLQGYMTGLIIAIPDTADRLAQNQQRAAALRHRAAQIAIEHGAHTIGLGNALAVVAGRGAFMAERISKPVTTGDASTAWTCAQITTKAISKHQLENEPIGLLGELSPALFL